MLTSPLGLISDVQRNLILQHANSGVFQHNYLSQYITQDTQAIYRGLAPQTAVIRAASGMARTIDHRRPRALNDQQLAEVGRHPEVKLLQRRKEGLKRRIRAKYGTISRAQGTKSKSYMRYREAYGQVQSKKKAVKKAMLAEIKARYREQQPVADIVRQLGSTSAKNKHSEAERGPQDQLCDERLRAFTALFTFAAHDQNEERARRSEAINAVTALCRLERPRVRRACRRKQVNPEPAVEESTCKGAKTVEAAEPIPIECLPTQCIFCLGNVHLTYERRTKAFFRRDTLQKHFRAHLSLIPDGQEIDCPHPECDERLSHHQHIQNHAARVHKTIT